MSNNNNNNNKKAFDYSKWDKIELSDDEDDVHPNIDKESWFRLKHRSRVEREENEQKDIEKIERQMSDANQRIAVLQHDLAKLDRSTKKTNHAVDSDDEDDDDNDDIRAGLQAELTQLHQDNQLRQQTLDAYAKNKKWNVDNMFQVKEERTMVNPNAAKENFTATGYVVPPKEDEEEEEADLPWTDSDAEAPVQGMQQTTLVDGKAPPADAAVEPQEDADIDANVSAEGKPTAMPPTTAANSSKDESVTAKAEGEVASSTASPTPATTTKKTTAISKKKSPVAGPDRTPVVVEKGGAMETYHEFTERHADTVERFMHLNELEQSKDFLLQHGDILLQENAANYLLLASLEDEMNGQRDAMKRTARQCQIVSNITELAKSLRTHPGNVILVFFARLGQRATWEEFQQGVVAFQEKIIGRAVVKKQEIDKQRRQLVSNGEGGAGGNDLASVPREERLGPGGLDPLEVIETLPEDMVAAFESRNVDDLKAALLKLDPEQAEYHMKRCVDAGLWVQ